MEEYLINDQDLNNIIFKRSGKKYSIYNKNIYEKTYEKYTIKLENMLCRFGIEKYNSKKIVNLEFNEYKKNNKMLNQFNDIKQMDNFMKNINLYNDSYILSDLEDKQYLSCLREKKNYNPLIRLHIKEKSKNILTNFTSRIDNVNLSDIKGRVCNVTFEIGDLWINEYNYGLILYITDIEVLI